MQKISPNPFLEISAYSNMLTMAVYKIQDNSFKQLVDE